MILDGEIILDYLAGPREITSVFISERGRQESQSEKDAELLGFCFLF